jgi:hypothetical protein
MALTITRANHKLNFQKGDTPSEAQFAALIDAFPMIYSEEGITLTTGDNTFTHGNAEKARIVQVLDSDGKEIDVTWRRDPSDATNKVIVNVAKGYSNAEISILTKA